MGFVIIIVHVQYVALKHIATQMEREMARSVEPVEIAYMWQKMSFAKESKLLEKKFFGWKGQNNENGPFLFETHSKLKGAPFVSNYKV